MEGLPVLLTVIFVILKLTGAITWSWWWVFSPLLFVVGIYALVGIFALIIWLVAGKSIKRAALRRWRR